MLSWKNWQKFAKRHPKWILAAKFLPVLILFWTIGWWRLDPDFGWHLQAGGYIRAHGVPAHDIYTYTARNFAWINHEWGNDVILSWLYQYLGYFFTAGVYACLWTLGVFMISRRLSFLTIMLAAIALLPYAGIRPVAWTVVIFALLIELAGRRSAKVKFLIPLLFIVWANLHAGFVIGLIYLAYLAATRRSKPWAYVLIASILATFVNAYGPRLYVEVARTLFDRQLHSQIAEWQPLYVLTASWPYIIAWLSGFWLFSKAKIRDYLRFDTLLFVAAMSSSRNIVLFVVGSASNLDIYLKRAFAMVPKNLDWPRKAVLAALVIAALVGIGDGVKESYWPFAPRDSAYPLQAVAYLQQNSCQGNLFNDYDYGGYLIWKLPSEPVYIDGRMPSWKAPDGVKYLDTYIQVIKNKQVRLAQFKKYDISCVLLRRVAVNRSMINQLKKSGWRTITQANGAVLLLKP